MRTNGELHHLAKQASMALTRSIRVLTVDDHELIRAGLCSLLRPEEDIDIIGEAATGALGLINVRRALPDVLLLDAHLPDMPGSDVGREVATSFPDIAVAILTAYAYDELVRSCVRAGAKGYLLKEISRFDLAASIRALAAGETVIDRRVLPQVLAVARQNVGSLDLDIPLNKRQRDILGLVADGLTNREIGERIQLSELRIKVIWSDS